ncbi:hypothetical protein [Streptomyces californicus]|uniref:hypothetical protein n=1 Tax=Streptomyces californicus TaxID=67351 RepID=UPI0037119D78
MAAAATAGGAAVVQVASTDAWTWFRTRVARLVGRGDAAREGEALDRLDRTAASLLAASEGERDRVREVHARLWQGEFGSLLESLDEADRIRLADALRELEAEFAAPPGGGTLRGNTFHGPTAVQTGDHNQQTNDFGSAR